jgi:hypothetical protein
MFMKTTCISIQLRVNVLKKACNMEINISSFVDIELRRYITLIEGEVGIKTVKDAGNGIRTRVTSLGS